MANAQVLFNGAPVPDILESKSDTKTALIFTVKRDDGTHAAGLPVSVEVDSPMTIDRIRGNLDANGQWPFTVGPMNQQKGLVEFDVVAGGKKKTFKVLFF